MGTTFILECCVTDKGHSKGHPGPGGAGTLGSQVATRACAVTSWSRDFSQLVPGGRDTQVEAPAWGSAWPQILPDIVTT